MALAVSPFFMWLANYLCWTMFKIHLGNPEIARVCETNSLSLREAIESAFQVETDYMYLQWKYIHIPISYKYDAGYMVHKLIQVMQFLEDPAQTELEHWFMNDTFVVRWKINKTGANVSIVSNWEAVPGGLQAQLNAMGVIVLNANEMLAELHKLMQFMVCAIRRSDIDPSLVNDFHLLLDAAGKDYKEKTRIKMILGIFGDELNTSQITELTGITPTKASNKAWTYATPYIETLVSDDVSVLIESQFSSKVTLLAPYIKEHRWEAQLAVVVQIVDEHLPGIYLPPSLVKLCEELGAAVDIDMYQFNSY
jgi:hypothetical protein